jgi:multiple sugar transport system substrate-binding protein
MPRLGKAAATGAGSWNFAISSNCAAPEAASKVLEHLLGTAEILKVTAVNGAMPATREAQAASPHYAPGGALRLFLEQTDKGVARVRPQTPAYPVISAAFAAAVQRIALGADVQRELNAAAQKIDNDLAANDGYGAK